MNKQEFFGKLKEIVKEEEVPRLNWLSLLSMTTDRELAKYIGSYKLKGAETRFMEPPLHFIYLGRYYRIDRKVNNNMYMRATNIFTSQAQALELSGKTYTKQEGDVLVMLLFGVLIEGPQAFTDFVYPIKKSSLAEWIGFVRSVSARNKKLTEGFIKLETKERQVETGIKILVPQFSFVDDLNFEVDYDSLASFVESYKQKIEAYVEYINSRITPISSAPVIEEVAEVEETDNDIPF